MKRVKLVTIVIRGCVFRVTPEVAREMKRLESVWLNREWNTNTLSE